MGRMFFGYVVAVIFIGALQWWSITDCESKSPVCQCIVHMSWIGMDYKPAP